MGAEGGAGKADRWRWKWCRFVLDGVKTRRRIMVMGLPGKPPGSPIFFDPVGNRIGNRLKAGVSKDRVGYIADKDS